VVWSGRLEETWRAPDAKRCGMIVKELSPVSSIPFMAEFISLLCDKSSFSGPLLFTMEEDLGGQRTDEILFSW